MQIWDYVSRKEGNKYQKKIENQTKHNLKFKISIFQILNISKEKYSEKLRDPEFCIFHSWNFGVTYTCWNYLNFSQFSATQESRTITGSRVLYFPFQKFRSNIYVLKSLILSKFSALQEFRVWIFHSRYFGIFGNSLNISKFSTRIESRLQLPPRGLPKSTKVALDAYTYQTYICKRSMKNTNIHI